MITFNFTIKDNSIKIEWEYYYVVNFKKTNLSVLIITY